jgi:hypothetical protein
MARVAIPRSELRWQRRTPVLNLSSTLFSGNVVGVSWTSEDEELRKAAAKLANLVGIRNAKKPVQKKRKAGRTGSN